MFPFYSKNPWQEKKSKKEWKGVIQSCVIFQSLLYEGTYEICKTTLFPTNLNWARNVGLNICYHSNSTILGREYFQESMFSSGNANGLATFPQVFLTWGKEWGQSAASCWIVVSAFPKFPKILFYSSLVLCFPVIQAHSWGFGAA